MEDPAPEAASAGAAGRRLRAVLAAAALLVGLQAFGQGCVGAWQTTTFELIALRGVEDGLARVCLGATMLGGSALLVAAGLLALEGNPLVRINVRATVIVAALGAVALCVPSTVRLVEACSGWGGRTPTLLPVWPVVGWLLAAAPLAPLGLALAALPCTPGPPIATGRIRHDAEGLTAKASDGYEHRIAWRDVRRIAVFKRDRITTDAVCLALEIRTPDPGTCELDADTDPEGFWALVAAIRRTYPDSLQNWEARVVKPAFATNFTVIYERVAASQG